MTRIALLLVAFSLNAFVVGLDVGMRRATVVVVRGADYPAMYDAQTLRDPDLPSSRGWDDPDDDCAPRGARCI